MKLAMPKYRGNAKRELITEFRGLNVTDTGGEGNGNTTFSGMLNGGTDKYPFSASRLSRELIQYDESTCALHGGEVLARVQPPYLYYGDRQIDLGLTLGEKQMVMMGSDLLIFPDGKFFDTANGDSGDIDEGVTYTDSGNVTVSCIYLTDGKRLRYINGTVLSADSFSVEYINNDGEIYQDTVKGLLPTGYNSTGVFYKRVDSISTDAIEESKIMVAFEDGKLYYIKKAIIDNSELAITKFSDIVWEELTVESIELDAEETEVFNNKNLWKDNQYVNCAGTRIYLMPGQTYADIMEFYTINGIAQSGLYYQALGCAFSWKTRTLPFFDHVTVCNNRLFGCRKGIPYDGTATVNRIYVSALGNYKAFEQFQGISTDSWYGDCGEEGAFTGACTFEGHPMFFKDNIAYILYGDYPPYSYGKVDIRGVAEGAAKSLLSVNGVLYWKSRHDIIQYTGSSLRSISAPLGDISHVERAVAGTWQNKYYIVLDGVIYVYDTMLDMWAREDVQDVQDFAQVGGKMYFLTDAGKVYAVGDEVDEDIPWSLTSPPIGYSLPNRKYISQLRIRIELAEGSELPTVELSLDGNEFIACNSKASFQDVSGKSTGTILIPIRPKRCETFRYRLSGIGAYKLTGVTKVIEESGR